VGREPGADGDQAHGVSGGLGLNSLHHVHIYDFVEVMSR
jgi:hypothetical protein